jgi:hypothetical protein
MLASSAYFAVTGRVERKRLPEHEEGGQCSYLVVYSAIWQVQPSRRTFIDEGPVLQI